MSQIFPKVVDKVVVVLGAVLGLSGVLIAGSIWYYFSPEFTDVGYRPKQPVDYSHKLHAGDLGIDCRYCHTGVEISAYATVPPTQTCMNCHTMVLSDSPKLEVVRDSWVNNKPIEWVRVHDLPDYVYFDHSAHINVGVGCESCHGNVANMEVVKQVEPLSMAWCLDCHRNPDMHLRPLDQVTVMNWQPPRDQEKFAAKVKAEKYISPPVDCTGCHR